MSWWGSGAEPTADGAADKTAAAAGGSDSDLQQQLDEKQQELEEVQMEVEVLQKNLEMQVSGRLRSTRQLFPGGIERLAA